jgi:hypothetical protein
LHTVELARTRTVVGPLTATKSRIHLTVSRELLSKLRKARAGQTHVMPGATDERVIEAGLDLLLAQQEKRRASMPPKVKRDVRLEIDHVIPRGAPSSPSGWTSVKRRCMLAAWPP